MAEENAKKIQNLLNIPDESKGEKLEVFADDVFPFEETEGAEKGVPELLEPDEEKGERLLVISDVILFLDQDRPKAVRKNYSQNYDHLI